jgi:hypothetical protein
MLILNRDKIIAGALGGMFVFVVGLVIFQVSSEKTFEDCILSRIKDSTSESAVKEIRAACELKEAKSDGLWSKYQRYVVQSELAKCGVPADSYNWHPPVGDVNTNKIISNLKNISVDWREKNKSYGASEISFQNNNSFEIQKVILGFVNPKYIEYQGRDLGAELFHASPTKPPFSPEAWLAQKGAKNTILTDNNKCAIPHENFELVIECKGRYSYSSGVGAGKYAQLDCYDAIPERFKEMNACLISASEKSFWYASDLLRFIKANGFCKRLGA